MITDITFFQQVMAFLPEMLYFVSLFICNLLSVFYHLH